MISQMAPKGQQTRQQAVMMAFVSCRGGGEGGGAVSVGGGGVVSKGQEDVLYNINQAGVSCWEGEQWAVQLVDRRWGERGLGVREGKRRVCEGWEGRYRGRENCAVQLLTSGLPAHVLYCTESC